MRYNYSINAWSAYTPIRKLPSMHYFLSLLLKPTMTKKIKQTWTQNLSVSNLIFLPLSRHSLRCTVCVCVCVCVGVTTSVRSMPFIHIYTHKHTWTHRPQNFQLSCIAGDAYCTNCERRCYVTFWFLYHTYRNHTNPRNMHWTHESNLDFKP